MFLLRNIRILFKYKIIKPSAPKIDRSRSQEVPKSKALTGKHFGVLDRWLLMGGGRTLKFDCTGNEVLVCYEELARGWSNESEKVKYCEGIII